MGSLTRVGGHPWAPLEGYVTNFLKKHFWKVRDFVEREDIMQTAFVIYLEVLKRYGPAVGDNRKWMMALFMRTFNNYFNGLISKRMVASDNTVQLSDSESEEGDKEAWITRYDSNSGYMLKLVDGAVDEIGEVLKVLLSAPSEILEVAASAWRTTGRKRKKENKQLIELLGLDYDPELVDILNEVESYLVGDRDD